MARRVNSREGGLPDQVYVELVRSLFGMLLPSVVMSVLFVGIAVLSVLETGDGALLALGVVGTMLSALRLTLVVTGRRDMAGSITDRRSALIRERRFATCYVGFAAVLGMFGARAMTLPDVALQMVVASLLVGYAAGVAAGISLRPRIGGASMLLAVIPAAAVSLARAETHHVALGVVLLALLVGGLQSMHARYAAEIDKIEIRRTMSGLARLDHLTGLPNRLGLAECFEEATAGRDDDCLIAVHCLDLDRFKPVNDRHGHPVGDELLRLVSGRLAGALRQGDVAARIGGDEFVVLQCGMRRADEAELLARRLSRTLGEPYHIGDRGLYVGASIGYVVSRCDQPLADLLARADNALYAIKAAGGGAAAHSDLMIGKASVTV